MGARDYERMIDAADLQRKQRKENGPMTAKRHISLSDRQVKALLWQAYLTDRVQGRFYINNDEMLTREEMGDLLLRLRVLTGDLVMEEHDNTITMSDG